MGYYANGNGDVALKEKVNRDELREKLDKFIKERVLAIDYDLDDTSMTMYFWEADSRWREENIMDFLNLLTPYITEGCVEYTGEDDFKWRYILKNGEWIEQEGMVYYTLDDMIKELQKQGYEINKL